MSGSPVMATEDVSVPSQIKQIAAITSSKTANPLRRMLTVSWE
jgi:hypothetical protein